MNRARNGTLQGFLHTALMGLAVSVLFSVAVTCIVIAAAGRFCVRKIFGGCEAGTIWRGKGKAASFRSVIRAE